MSSSIPDLSLLGSGQLGFKTPWAVAHLETLLKNRCQSICSKKYSSTYSKNMYKPAPKDYLVYVNC
jgi:hypothetical protein